MPLIVSQDTPVAINKSNTTCKNLESTDESLTISNSQTMAVVKTTSDTSCHLSKSPTALDVDKLKANMMAIKSFFMNEIYELRQEISSLQLKLQQEKLNQSGNFSCEKDEKIIIKNLKTKLEFYQRENQLLKDEMITKQSTIETILHQNNELLKLHQYYNKNIEEKEKKVKHAEEKVEKLNKISQESKKLIIGVDELTGKGTKRKNADQIIPYNPKNNLDVNPRKVKNTKKVFIVGDLMIKSITGTGISKSNTVNMRPHPGATTVDICDYIKPEYVTNPM